MGPFMVEIVFCPVTRRGRKKKKGCNKGQLGNMRNDGPAFRFVPQEDTVKMTLDLSDEGPVFSALDAMMMKMIDDESAQRKKVFWRRSSKIFYFGYLNDLLLNRRAPTTRKRR